MTQTQKPLTRLLYLACWEWERADRIGSRFKVSGMELWWALNNMSLTWLMGMYSYLIMCFHCLMLYKFYDKLHISWVENVAFILTNIQHIFIPKRLNRVDYHTTSRKADITIPKTTLALHLLQASWPFVVHSQFGWVKERNYLIGLRKMVWV